MKVAFTLSLSGHAVLLSFMVFALGQTKPTFFRANEGSRAWIEVTTPPIPVATERTEVNKNSEGEQQQLQQTKSFPEVALESLMSGENTPPIYPTEALERGWQGLVVLIVLFDPQGKTHRVSVHRTSGFSILDDSAVSAAQEWRAPEGFSERAVRVPIRFELIP